MTEIIYNILLVLLPLLSGTLYAASSHWLISSVASAPMRPRFWRIVFGFFEVAFFLVTVVSGIPLPLFYLLLYVLKLIELMTFSVKKKNLWLSINLSFLFTATLYLIVLGIFSLLSGLNTSTVLRSPLLRGGILCVVLCLDSAVMWSSGRKNAYLTIHQEVYSEESALFVQFSFLSIAFVMVDSAACLFELPHFMTSLFLIGSNGLLLMMLSFFLNQLSIIKKEIHLETEHDQLKADRLAQMARTETLRDSAYRDPLTGAHTRLYAYERLTALLESQQPFSLVYIDLDGLKGINDAYGHLAGDQYLKDFAARFKIFLRPGDVFARMGGDEFMLLIPDCAEAAAQEKIGGFRSRLELDDNGWQGIPLSFSFGVTGTAGGEQQSSEAMIRKADHDMYKDKSARRRKEELPL